MTTNELSALINNPDLTTAEVNSIIQNHNND
jgi:hypothetical protein